MKCYTRLSWVDTHIIEPVSFFNSVFSSWLSSLFFLKNLSFFISIGDIDETYRFWSIVISSFVCLTPNTQNLNVPLSCVPTLNILLKFSNHIFLKQIIFTEYKVIHLHCQNTHQVTSCIMPKKQCIVLCTHYSL